VKNNNTLNDSQEEVSEFYQSDATELLVFPLNGNLKAEKSKKLAVICIIKKIEEGGTKLRETFYRCADCGIQKHGISPLTS
jgi:hypothetical protein